MSTSPVVLDPRLSKNFTTSEVLSLVQNKDCAQLANFIEQRHEERYFAPINLLKDVNYAGFAMMSLCCLLIETFQCYRQGLATTHPGDLKHLTFTPPPEFAQPVGAPTGPDCFKNFFSDYAIDFNGIDGEQFYRHVRNGLLHQAQTKSGWTISKKGSEVWDPLTKDINRSLFADRIKDCFQRYVADLRILPIDHPTWVCARRKIWWVAKLS